MRFDQEPPPSEAGAPERAGVLLVNLGTPDAATPRALRRYLAEFLSDPRVVEIHGALWQPVLHGFVLRTRPARSARKYQRIWTAEGSPLAVWTRKQTALLRGYLGERGGCGALEVEHAMRYGQPSIASQLGALKARGCTRILLAPLYPQYSASTTGSAFDAMAAWAMRQRRVPQLRVLDPYYAHPDYIGALARRIRADWQARGQPDKLVMSFHGMPVRAARQGDPYARQCERTAQLLAARLALKPGQWLHTFQSRFGHARWLQPYTQATLEQLARSGVARVDVVCPGFASDCLETLEEIAIEARAAFLAAGGRQYHYIACLNDAPEWIAALAGMIERHLKDWVQTPEHHHQP
ncbi:MAG: ferrochelatase [Burkholderiaceae bacterium]|nr:ferrochelatase [Burkholderiaceae bacterium]